MNKKVTFINNKKFLKVMFGNKSSINDFEYKIGKVNIADTWNPDEKHPKDIGDFSFLKEDKIIRWLVRGDTIYDVVLPEDSEIVKYKNENIVFLTNKIILNNPKL